jgi:hypothetical protein
VKRDKVDGIIFQWFKPLGMKIHSNEKTERGESKACLSGSIM